MDYWQNREYSGPVKLVLDTEERKIKINTLFYDRYSGNTITNVKELETANIEFEMIRLNRRIKLHAVNEIVIPKGTAVSFKLPLQFYEDTPVHKVLHRQKKRVDVTAFSSTNQHAYMFHIENNSDQPLTFAPNQWIATVTFLDSMIPEDGKPCEKPASSASVSTPEVAPAE